MPKRKKVPQNDLGIPKEQMESLARVILPYLREYLASDEGKKDYEDWQANKQDLKENAVDQADKT